MSLEKIPNRTDYVDVVYKSLLDAISAGVLAPGERITQEDLAEKLNVSMSPRQPGCLLGSSNSFKECVTAHWSSDRA